jgi:hypothetical protein
MKKFLTLQRRQKRKNSHFLDTLKNVNASHKYSFFDNPGI